MPTIVLATQNPGKINELQSLLKDSGIDVIGLDGFDQSFPEPDESGDTFLENATIKAIAYAKATSMHCLADDSGLIIDALNGKPGVISSHYAFDGDVEGQAASMTRQERDDRNCERVMLELTGITDERRTARFTCTMVFADPTGAVLASSEGLFEGRIGQDGEVPRGENGFGYDPLFLVAPHFENTSAEMETTEKNKISHRAKAVQSMIREIESIFSNK
ncbi:MAG: RdgB/HAM1 family non-canonical purine NTP pyrophosphatase [Phycisphaerales bacterium]|nr:RdgB/HAM1 family non-canonical purine NTP pyrophosphatase [Phycisphaerales bacterium]